MSSRRFEHPENIFSAASQRSVAETFFEVLRQRALGQADREAIAFLHDPSQVESFSYRQLDLEARKIAAAVLKVAEPGDRILLLFQPGWNYIAALFGCFYAGCVAVPAYPPRPNRKLTRLEAIVAEADASVALTTQSMLELTAPMVREHTGLSAMAWLATDRIAAGLERQWQPPNLSGESLALLQYTSGSTDTPRGVMVTHANLLENAQLICDAFEHTANSQGVIWLPPYHDMGLIGGILQPIYAGFPCTLMPPMTVIQRPLRWLQAITRFGGTTSGGPNFAYDLCVRRIRPAQRDELDLSSWNVAFNGAEPINAETLDRFSEYFAPCGFRREAFYPCYGLAEATLMVSGGSKAEAPTRKSVCSLALQQHEIAAPTANDDNRQELISCGKVRAGQQVVIVDPDTETPTSSGRIGEIWMSGPSVAKGYWARPEDTRRTFAGQLATNKTAGPFLRTGDLGVLLEDELYVTGRIKEMLIIRGRNFYPQDLEATVQACDSVLRAKGGAAFSIQHDSEAQLVIAQEVERRAVRDHDFNELFLQIRQSVVVGHQIQVHGIALVAPGAIPRTSSGKIQRHLARQQYEQGAFECVADWRIVNDDKVMT